MSDGMKVGMPVRYTGAIDAQIKWASCSDPRGVLTEGEIYRVSAVEPHSWYTNISLDGQEGKFNSVCFSEVVDAGN